jgi:hypothetical protein
MGSRWQLDCIRGWKKLFQRSAWNAINANADSEETRMDSNYVFLCGVMWCRFGQQEAGKELLRATNSVDPDKKALAWAMFAKGVSRLRELERRAQPCGTILGRELSR